MISPSFSGVPSRSLCPSDLGHPRTEVMCYYEGRRPVSDIDPCYCTHLVYANVGIDEDSKIDVTNGENSVFRLGKWDDREATRNEK